MRVMQKKVADRGRPNRGKMEIRAGFYCKHKGDGLHARVRLVLVSHVARQTCRIRAAVVKRPLGLAQQRTARARSKVVWGNGSDNRIR